MVGIFKVLSRKKSARITSSTKTSFGKWLMTCWEVSKCSILTRSSIETLSQPTYFSSMELLNWVTWTYQRSWMEDLQWPKLEPHTTQVPKSGTTRATITDAMCGHWDVSCMSSVPFIHHLWLKISLGWAKKCVWVITTLSLNFTPKNLQVWSSDAWQLIWAKGQPLINYWKRTFSRCLRKMRKEMLNFLILLDVLAFWNSWTKSFQKTNTDLQRRSRLWNL